jgi:hypothetical protein
MHSRVKAHNVPKYNMCYYMFRTAFSSPPTSLVPSASLSPSSLVSLSSPVSACAAARRIVLPCSPPSARSCLVVTLPGTVFYYVFYYVKY